MVLFIVLLILLLLILIIRRKIQKKINKRILTISAVALVAGIIFGIINQIVGYSVDLVFLKLTLFSLGVFVLSLTALGLYNLFLYVAKDQERTANEREEKEQLIIDYEYEQANISQKLTQPWATRYEVSACPYCGHYKVRIAKWDDKRVSVAIWGVASDKIGKTYICDNCKQMW